MKLVFFERIGVVAENVEESGVESQLILGLERIDDARVAIARLMIPQTHALLQFRLPNSIRHGRLPIQTN